MPSVPAVVTTFARNTLPIAGSPPVSGSACWNSFSRIPSTSVRVRKLLSTRFSVPPSPLIPAPLQPSGHPTASVTRLATIRLSSPEKRTPSLSNVSRLNETTLPSDSSTAMPISPLRDASLRVISFAFEPAKLMPAPLWLNLPAAMRFWLAVKTAMPLNALPVAVACVTTSGVLSSRPKPERPLSDEVSNSSRLPFEPFCNWMPRAPLRVTVTLRTTLPSAASSSTPLPNSCAVPCTIATPL
jgi:hypothetical protein